MARLTSEGGERGRLIHLVRAIGSFQRKTQREIAESLGLGETGLAALIHGRSKRPSNQTTKLLELVYGVRSEWLLSGKGPIFLEDRFWSRAKNGITLYQAGIHKGFYATLEGWARILTWRRDETDSPLHTIGLVLAEHASEVESSAPVMHSVPMPGVRGSKVPKFLLISEVPESLPKGEPYANWGYLLVSNESRPCAIPGQKEGPALFCVERAFDRSWDKISIDQDALPEPRSLAEMKDRNEIPMEGHPRYSLLLAASEHRSMEKGPYPKQ